MGGSIDWPPLREPKLLERLALDDAEFDAFARKLARLVKPRPFTSADAEHAFGYPWPRPRRSYLLSGETATPLERLPVGVLDSDAGDARRRYTLLAYGSNAAPRALARKFAALAPDRRDAYVVLGRLRDFDAGASAHAAFYGALPATIFASDGCEMNCAVVLVTAEQLAAIAWTEVNYHFGALEGAEFAADIETPPLGRIHAFVSRRGAFGPDGEPAALAGVESRGRGSSALSQRQLLNLAASAALGEQADAHRLLEALFKDYAVTSELVANALRSAAIRFDAPGWSRFSPG